MDPIAGSEVGLLASPIQSKDKVSRMGLKPSLDKSIELFDSEERGERKGFHRMNSSRSGERRLPFSRQPTHSMPSFDKALSNSCGGFF
jgi:hypothetical protein